MAAATVRSLVQIASSAVLILGGTGVAHAQRTGVLPTCTGWSNCNPGEGICTFADRAPYEGPTVVADFADGVSSDGRGPYAPRTDGVFSMVVLGGGGLGLRSNPDSIIYSRTLRVNLNNPVPGGGGTPLGVLTSGSDDMLFAAWKRIGNAAQSLHDILVGLTVTAAQLNVSVHLGERFYVLQMGPQPLGICHTNVNRVNGAGTSTGTIYRASQTKWVIDLPAGSIGRLFDLHNTTHYAVDRGLYYVRLHFEIGQ